MAIIFKAPDALCDVPMHYCRDVLMELHGLVAEAIDELEIEGKTIGISPVGCAYNNYLYSIVKYDSGCTWTLPLL